MTRAKTPETFTVTLGATQDDVTHLNSLPMRADLQSVTGNGTNLTVLVHRRRHGRLPPEDARAGASIISIKSRSWGPRAPARSRRPRC